jgi:hypothetical protein
MTSAHHVIAGQRRSAGLAWFATLALIGSLVVALALPSIAVAGYTDPTELVVPNTMSGTDELKMTCLIQTADPPISSDTCHVLQWNGYTYWAMSYNDNRTEFAIVAINELGQQAGRWNRSGARYLVDLTIDTTAGTVTFIGQAGATVVMTLQELYLAPLPPTITASENITAYVNWGEAGTTVSYPAPTTTGDVGTVTCSPASGSFFPVGTTTVTCSSSNSAAVDTFTVTVSEIVIPTGDLLNQLRSDTIDYVTNSTAERALVATIDQALAAEARGNTWGVYTLMLKYVVQLDRYADSGAVSGANGQQLNTLVHQIMDGLF